MTNKISHTVAIEGIELSGPIGVYHEEKINGCKFIIDVYITKFTDFDTLEDSLEHTIDYELIYKTIQNQMEKPFNLIETAINSIYSGIVEHYSNIQEVRIKIRKIHPFKGKNVELAFVEGVFPL